MRKQVKLPLLAHGKNKTFKSKGELQNFLDTETATWSFCCAPNSALNETKQLLNNINAYVVRVALQSIQEVLDAWSSNNEDSLETKLTELRESVKVFSFPYSCTQLGQYILKEAEQSDITAALMIYFSVIESFPTHVPTVDNAIQHVYKNGTNNFNAFAKFMSMFPLHQSRANKLLALYDLKINKPSLHSFSQFIESAQQQINTSLAQSDELIAEHFESFNSHKQKWSADEQLYRDKLAKRYKYFRRKDRELRTKLKERAVTANKEALATTAAAKDVYHSQVELDASITYWESKLKTHSTSRNWWLFSLVISIILTVLVPILMLLFQPIQAINKVESSYLILGVINPIGLALTILLVSMGSFSIKFCSRQFSTQEHLKLEALERKTMLKTFLALMNEEKLKEQEDRKIALDTLFRPAQTGIVADYGNVAPSDTVVKVFDKHVSRGAG